MSANTDVLAFKIAYCNLTEDTWKLNFSLGKVFLRINNSNYDLIFQWLAQFACQYLL